MAIRVNGQLDHRSLPKRDDGLIAVPVPQGPVDLTVDWTITPDVVAGRWLSASAHPAPQPVRCCERQPRPRSSNMNEMPADVKSLIQEGAELTDQALE